MGLRSGEPARILLVDDDPKGLAALEATLAPLHQTLVRATSGREALRQLLHHEVAVILLDVMLPDMDGFETAQLIRERERTRQTPIVFLTAMARSELPELRAYAVGAVDYLLKPYDPDILRSKVSVFVDLHHKTLLARRQEEALREAQTREHERALAEATRRLEMERALAREQVLHEEMKTLRLRDGVFSLASQELKAPLGALTQQLQQLLLGAGSPDPVAQPPGGPPLAALREMEHHVRRLDVLVDNLLDLARLGDGELQLAPEDVDLSQLVRELAERFEEDLQRSHCTLELQLPPSAPGQWDRRRVEQVVTTLLGCALRRGVGHPIRVGVGPARAGGLQLSVHCAGHEPRAEALAQALRGDLPPPPGDPDALALWLVQQLMARMGGRLEVESGAGRGLTLYARLGGSAAQEATEGQKTFDLHATVGEGKV
ncbi:MAG TPA: hybrid sensor histidine kinase/response regulator [Aggregicoccus sp.]|nr:hybrid sensor histidine kinase/response regulator [Aggregicoccus sp.]